MIKPLFILFVMSLFGCANHGYPGLTGQNGHSAAFGELVSADTSLCNEGGSVLPYGVDMDDDGVLQSTETKGLQIACNGSTGAAGATGSTGTQGQAGVNGTNGTNAVSVTVVPLCPGVTSYGTFIEVGLCLGGNVLIGVYSANNGFATVLSPGSYASNAIGSACNLTVGPNCQVSH